MHKYRILLRYAGRQRRSFLLIAVLTIAASFLAAAQPWPMAIVVDQVLKKLPRPAAMEAVFQWLGVNPTPSALLLIAVLGGLTIFVLNSALEMALTTAWTLAGRRMVYHLAEDLFARLQRRSLLYHSRNPVGDVMSRITGDCWCVNQMVDALLFSPAHALLTSAIMVLLMAQYGWEPDVAGGGRGAADGGGFVPGRASRCRRRPSSSGKSKAASRRTFNRP